MNHLLTCRGCLPGMRSSFTISLIGSLMNTYFQHKEAHKWTWYGWNSIKGTYDQQSQIDLFLSSNKTRIRNVKAIPSVSLDSDHRLVLTTTRYRVQKCRPSLKQKRVDLQKLKDCSERDRKYHKEDISRQTNWRSRTRLERNKNPSL